MGRLIDVGHRLLAKGVAFEPLVLYLDEPTSADELRSGAE